MKNLLILLVFFAISNATIAQKNKHKCMKQESVLRHIVIFKYKDSSSPQDVQKVSDTFMALKKQIPEIVDMEYGTNVSPENFNQGFTHCYVLTFKTEADANSYQQNPAHKAFQEVLKPHMDKVFVIDYWRKSD